MNSDSGVKARRLIGGGGMFFVIFSGNENLKIVFCSYLRQNWIGTSNQDQNDQRPKNA